MDERTRNYQAIAAEAARLMQEDLRNRFLRQIAEEFTARYSMRRQARIVQPPDLTFVDPWPLNIPPLPPHPREQVNKEDRKVTTKEEFDKYLEDWIKLQARDELQELKDNYRRTCNDFKQRIRDQNFKIRQNQNMLAKKPLFDYDLIANDKRVMSIELHGYYFTMVTHTIVIPYKGHNYYIGNLEVTLPFKNMKGLKLRRYRCPSNALFNFNDGMTTSQHPHYAENPCFGTYDTQLLIAMDNLNYTTVFLLLLDYLYSYNAKSPLVKISGWPAMGEDGVLYKPHKDHSLCSDCGECITCHDCDACTDCHHHECICCESCETYPCECSCDDRGHSVCTCCEHCYECSSTNPRRRHGCDCYRCSCCDVCKEHDDCDCADCDNCGNCIECVGCDCTNKTEEETNDN